MDEEPEGIDRLIQGLRKGNPTAVQEFCRLYGPALLELADRRLHGALRRRVEATDVLQSVYRTFLRRLQLDQFRLADTEDLWRLLTAITLNKLRTQARFHRAARRDVLREESVPLTSEDDTAPEPACSQPTPAELFAFADEFEQLLAEFSDEERRMVELKLQDFTNEETARQLRCSERTVRRMMDRIRNRLGGDLGSSHDEAVP